MSRRRDGRARRSDQEILARLDAFKSERVKPGFEPFVASALGEETSRSLARHSAEWSRRLVGIQVERKYQAEILPRTPWESFQAGIPDWKDKDVADRTRISNT